MKQNFQEIIFKELKKFFNPLLTTEGNEEMLHYLFKEMGWEMDAILDDHEEVFIEKIRSIISSLSVLDDIIEQPPKTILEFSDTLKRLDNLFVTIKNVKTNLPEGLGNTLEEFPKDLINFLSSHYLSTHTPIVFYVMALLTIVSQNEPDFVLSDEEILLRIKNTYAHIELSSISQVLRNPQKVLKEKYCTEGFADTTAVNKVASKLFPILKLLLEALGIDTYLGNGGWMSEYPREDEEALKGLMILSKEIASAENNETAKIELAIGILPETEGGPGVYVIPNGDLEVERYLDPWYLQFKSTLGHAGFQITKDGLEIYDSGGSSGKMQLLVARVQEEDRASLIGSTEGTRIEVKDFHINAGLHYIGEVKELKIQAHLDQLSFALMPGDGDGFLKSILPKKGASVNFDVTFGWSNIYGFHFEGNSDLELNIPLHKQVLRALEFKDIRVKIEPSTQKLSLITAASINITIGPLTTLIEEVGLGADVAFPEDGGNLGLIDLDLDFKLPKSIAVKINSEILTGGGFLEPDHENHRYAGVLAVKLALEKIDIELTAIGLINAQLPNGQEGFSMLVSISTFFTPPFQLAFGFTLNAVGGLMGVHRTMKVDTLKERIQNGAIKSIMFPENVIENSTKIISDLRSVFPAQKNHYVVAPFFKIGYGTPTVLEADLGILTELPFKGRLILIGGLHIYLPNKEVDKRLGEIHVDIFGDFNFASSYVLIEGRLRDSQLVGIPFFGGFAFILDWGSNPQFLLSIGGYHPRYKKPTRFPAIPRLTALVKKGNDIRLSCEFYQAITSNSYQIGFNAELVVKKGKARAYGFLGFNALLQFDPFYFETDIRISVKVMYRGRTFLGVDLAFLLSGPKPWRAQGYAKIKVLFFSLKVKFNISWGGEQKAIPAVIDPNLLLAKLKDQLQQSNNWSSKMSENYTKSASLRSLEEIEQQDQIFLHPAGYLELRQTLIPLNKTIEKLGNSYIKTKTSYQISEYTFGNGVAINAKTQKPLMDYFSRGQFEDLSNDQKLSTADFDLMSSGIMVSPERAYDISSELKSTPNGFEDIIIEEEESSVPKPSYNWQSSRILNISRRRSINMAKPAQVFGVVETLPDHKERAFKIMSKKGLETPPTLTQQHFNSYSSAIEHLKSNWSIEQQENWQIVQTETQEFEEVLF